MSDQQKHVTSIKFGVGYDAPWHVIHADSRAELVAEVNAFIAEGVDNLIAQAAVAAQAKWALAKGGVPTQQVSSEPVAPANPATQPVTAQAQQYQAPAQQPGVIQFPQQGQPQQQAPVQQAASNGGPVCEHGAYVWKDFVSKKGNAVKGFFCPGRNTQCQPQFSR